MEGAFSLLLKLWSYSCGQLNGGDFPYVSRKGGRFLEAKEVLFECGPKCDCGLECVNCTSQRRLKHRLEVYCTKRKDGLLDLGILFLRVHQFTNMLEL